MLEAAAARADQLAAPGLDPRPRLKVAVLACMDTRLDIFPMLGLNRGDAHIIRNAGGLVTDDALRSLTVSQHLLGTEEVIVLMHDDCGLHGASEEDFAKTLAAKGAVPTWKLGAFDDVERALSLGLARLRSTPSLLARDAVRGFVFNPDTGDLRQVEPFPADAVKPKRGGEKNGRQRTGSGNSQSSPIPSPPDELCTTLNESLALHHRLHLCFANLASYGIRALPDLPMTVEEGRATVVADIFERYPDAIGSYVFWTAADAACFTFDGNLLEGNELPLYHSGPDVVRAVRASCEQLDIKVHERDEEDILFVAA